MQNISNKIIWTVEAQQGFYSIIDYLESKFSEKTAQKFINAFYHQIYRISRFPNTFPLIESSKLMRSALVLGLTSILFTIKEDKIVLYAVYDNRQLPPKIGV